MTYIQPDITPPVAVYAFEYIFDQLLGKRRSEPHPSLPQEYVSEFNREGLHINRATFREVYGKAFQRGCLNLNSLASPHLCYLMWELTLL